MFERTSHWLFQWWYGVIGVVVVIVYIQTNVLPVVKSYLEVWKLKLEIGKLRRERKVEKKAEQQPRSDLVKPTLDDIRRYDEKIRAIELKIEVAEANKPRQGVSGPTGTLAMLLLVVIFIYLLSKDVPNVLKTY